MLIFVSDLHLTDTRSRTTIDLCYFIKRLERIIIYARQDEVDEIELVLLGDIFELLKSVEWLRNNEKNFRPWDLTFNGFHTQTVNKIFEGILINNECFFAGLRRLHQDYKLKITYVPGNHDRAINEDIGLGARKLLQAELPLERLAGSKFVDMFTCMEHKVVAYHGHEWDESNHYSEKGAAIGDAVVIDVVARLPYLVGEYLGLDCENVALDFLHEIDNFYSHNPGVLKRWIELHLTTLDAAKNKNKTQILAEEAVYKAIKDIAQYFIKLAQRTQFHSLDNFQQWRILKPTLRLISTTTKVTPGVAYKLLFALLNLWADKEGYEGGGHPSVSKAVARLDTLQPYHDYCYIISGHTHKPLVSHFPKSAKASEQISAHLNTGTWRKIYRPTSPLMAGSPFSWQYEESLVIVYSPKEHNRLRISPYELHRTLRGAKR